MGEVMTGYQSKKDMAQDKLAQPAQEPVAWVDPATLYNLKIGLEGVHLVYETEMINSLPLYEKPQRTWVDLTDEEIDELHGSPMSLEHSGELKWVRIIEAKLKEKNNG
jgi:hypothetical protein